MADATVFRPLSAIFVDGAGTVAAGLENGFRPLLEKPAEKLLVAFVGADFLHCVENIAQLIMRPSLVDEVLAAMAGGRDLASAFAARHDVMSARGHLPEAKDTAVIHKPFQVRQKNPARQSEIAGSVTWDAARPCS
jgi:hypothetical protein